MPLGKMPIELRIENPKQEFAQPSELSALRPVPAVRWNEGLTQKGHSYGCPLRFRQDRPRRLLKRGVSVGAVDAFGNRVRKRRAMSPTGPSRVIADSMTAAAVRR